MKLSIIMPGVRPHNWLKVYQSIPNATDITNYELVIVSPCDLPPELRDIENVRLIKDKGCPTRANQIGLLHSRGEYCSWCADDAVYSPTMSIDKAFDVLPPVKGVVSLRHSEPYKGASLEKLSWWRVERHAMLSRLKYIPNHYMIILVPLIRRDYLMEIGGWDCQFQQPGISNMELGIRLQKDGATAVLGEKALICSNEKTEPGGATPQVVNASKNNDIPLLQKIYSHKSAKHRKKVDFDNWKQAVRWS